MRKKLKRRFQSEVDTLDIKTEKNRKGIKRFISKRSIKRSKKLKMLSNRKNIKPVVSLKTSNQGKS